ncbi:MAG: hypothetical protein IT384_19375 [Deltaproteobacteria bacterium]|nr:hypothetical protein [Deltaproteobacteria bacterium]
MKRWEGGYLRIAEWHSAPVRVHFTFPILAIYFAGLEVGPLVGFFLLILVHELGHAVLVRWCGHVVTSIEVAGFGGLCRWAGSATPADHALIAWGGVWAQGVLYLGTELVIAWFGPPTTRFTAGLASVFTYTSAWIMFFNLIPVEPLDGSRAWSLFGILRRSAREERDAERARQRHAQRPADPPREVRTAPPPDGSDPNRDRLTEARSEERFEKMLHRLYGDAPPPDVGEREDDDER